jgi:hypothetical protein
MLINQLVQRLDDEKFIKLISLQALELLVLDEVDQKVNHKILSIGISP